MFLIQFPFTMFYFKPLLEVVYLTFGITIAHHFNIHAIMSNLYSTHYIFCFTGEDPNGQLAASPHDQPEGMFVFENLADKLMKLTINKSLKCLNFLCIQH